MNEVNVSGTLNVLAAALRDRVQRILFASSAAVYGNTGFGRVKEEAPQNPINSYGASKLAAEKYCQAFHGSFSLETVCLRYFNVYGQRQSSTPYSGVVAIFVDRLSRNLRPVIYGDGSQTRDFIHVSDVVNANLLALKTKKGAGESFNIGTGRPTNIIKLYRTLARLTGKPRLTPIFRPSRRGDIRHSCANTTKALSHLGFQAKIGLKEGLSPLATGALSSDSPRTWSSS
jgi:nucleoside-diphosphate-sugar epimerase